MQNQPQLDKSPELQEVQSKYGESLIEELISKISELDPKTSMRDLSAQLEAFMLRKYSLEPDIFKEHLLLLLMASYNQGFNDASYIKDTE